MDGMDAGRGAGPAVPGPATAAARRRGVEPGGGIMSTFDDRWREVARAARAATAVAGAAAPPGAVLDGPAGGGGVVGRGRGETGAGDLWFRYGTRGLATATVHVWRASGSPSAVRPGTATPRRCVRASRTPWPKCSGSYERPTTCDDHHRPGRHGAGVRTGRRRGGFPARPGRGDRPGGPGDVARAGEPAFRGGGPADPGTAKRSTPTWRRR